MPPKFKELFNTAEIFTFVLAENWKDILKYFKVTFMVINWPGVGSWYLQYNRKFFRLSPWVKTRGKEKKEKKKKTSKALVKGFMDESTYDDI